MFYWRSIITFLVCCFRFKSFLFEEELASPSAQEFEAFKDFYIRRWNWRFDLEKNLIWGREARKSLHLFFVYQPLGRTLPCLRWWVNVNREMARNLARILVLDTSLIWLRGILLVSFGRRRQVWTLGRYMHSHVLMLNCESYVRDSSYFWNLLCMNLEISILSWIFLIVVYKCMFSSFVKLCCFMLLHCSRTRALHSLILYRPFCFCMWGSCYQKPLSACLNCVVICWLRTACMTLRLSIWDRICLFILVNV